MKTVTLTPWGPYRYKRLAMGLKNSAQSFQKLMDWVLAGLEGTYCYMDDILLFSKSEGEHLKLVEEVFRRLTANGLAIHPDKCRFGKPALDFLGYHVTRQGVKPLEKKVEAIVAFPPPHNHKSLLGF